MAPFISICIPAYKNAHYLDILLRSIKSQSFPDYEVIVSDDSPDDSVKMLCTNYEADFTLTYQKNIPALGTPANWNESIRLAKGQWIKMMHDDDWFAYNESLAKFAEAAKQHASTGFIFSGYANYENGSLKTTNVLNSFKERNLKRSPLLLFKENYIGHPSTTLIKNNLAEWYDENIKWVVDIEFYMRYLDKNSFYAIHEPLINIGINSEQVTKEAFRNILIEIPENIYLLKKMGTFILKNVAVYDYYWRLFRNLEIRNVSQVEHVLPNTDIPAAIKKMIVFESKFSISILKIGVISKILMFLSFSNNFLFSNDNPKL